MVTENSTLLLCRVDTCFDSFPVLMSPLSSWALLLKIHSVENRRRWRSHCGLAGDSRLSFLLLTCPGSSSKLSQRGLSCENCLEFDELPCD